MILIGQPLFHVTYEMLPFRFPCEFQQSLTNKNVIVTKDDFVETHGFHEGSSYLTYESLRSVVRNCILRATNDDRLYCARMTFVTPCGREILIKDRWPRVECPDMQDKIVTIKRSDYLKIVINSRRMLCHSV